MEVDHLSKLIKASQARKNHLVVLLVELQRDPSFGTSTPDYLCPFVEKIRGGNATSAHATSAQTEGKTGADAEMEHDIPPDVQCDITMKSATDVQGKTNEEETHNKDVVAEMEV